MRYLRPAVVILIAAALCASCGAEDDYQRSSRVYLSDYFYPVAAHAGFRVHVRVPDGPTNLDDEKLEIHSVAVAPKGLVEVDGELPQGLATGHNIRFRTHEPGTATVEVAIETEDGDRLRNTFEVDIAEPADAVFRDDCEVADGTVRPRIYEPNQAIELEFRTRDEAGRSVWGLGDAFFTIEQGGLPVPSKVDLTGRTIEMHSEGAGDIRLRSERFGIDHAVGLVDPGDVDRIEVVQSGNAEGTFQLRPQLYAGDEATCREGDGYGISAQIVTPEVCQFWISEEGQAPYAREQHEAFDVWGLASGECSINFMFEPGNGGSGVRETFTVDISEQ